MELYQAKHFLTHIHSPFTITFENGLVVTLELTECLVRPRGVPKDIYGKEVVDHPSDRPFTLLFSGPEHPALPQRHYIITHEILGTLGIFLVPVSDVQNGKRYYQAVFN